MLPVDGRNRNIASTGMQGRSSVIQNMSQAAQQRSVLESWRVYPRVSAVRGARVRFPTAFGSHSESGQAELVGDEDNGTEMGDCLRKDQVGSGEGCMSARRAVAELSTSSTTDASLDPTDKRRKTVDIRFSLKARPTRVRSLAPDLCLSVILDDASEVVTSYARVSP